jgi:hypothetical protein
MSYNTISVRGDYVLEEHYAAATISPGNLLELDSDKKVKRHSNAGGAAEKAFALENSLAGEVISDDYSSSERVRYGIFAPGSLVYALIADGEDIEIGDQLISDGSGNLKEQSSEDEGSVIAIAMEDKDMTASAVTAADHALVRIV